MPGRAEKKPPAKRIFDDSRCSSGSMISVKTFWISAGLPVPAAGNPARNLSAISAMALSVREV